VSETLAPLRYPAFRYLVLGRVVNIFGGAMATIALAFAVLDLTGSATDLGLVVGARSVMNVLFILLGGVVADRLPRQLVMVVASFLSFASQAVVTTLFFTHSATIPVLAVLAAFNGVVSAFAFPAISAIVAQTVPGEIRKQANALNRLGFNLSTILGTTLGGAIIAAFGPRWGLAIDSLTFAVAGVLYSLVRVPRVREANASRTSTLHELRVGWTEFIARRWFWVVVLGFCFFNMAQVAGMSVLGPAIANNTFGPGNWAFILAAETVGAVLGAFVAIRLRARRLMLVGVASCVGPSVLMVSLGLHTPVPALVGIAFLAGIGLEQFGIAWETSVQEHIPADKLARVYSYDALGSWIAIPLGQVLAGPLSNWVGVTDAMLVFASISIISVIAMLADRSVRTLEHHATPSVVEPEPAPAVG
jgi:MFS family permease